MRVRIVARSARPLGVSVIQIAEGKLDEQVLALFARLRIQDDCEPAPARLRRSIRTASSTLIDSPTSLRQQQDRLLNLRLLEESR
jgi:hypothetical protein